MKTTFSPKHLSFSNTHIRNTLTCVFLYIRHRNPHNTCVVDFTVKAESKYALFLAEATPWTIESFTVPFSGTIHTIHSIEHLKQNTDKLRAFAVRAVQRKLRASNSIVIYWLKYATRSLRYSINPWRYELTQYASMQKLDYGKAFDQTGEALVKAL